MLSNQHIINELKAIRNSFIKTRPKMDMNSFVSSQKQAYNLGDGSQHRLHTFLQGAGAPMKMRHPLGYGSINGNTLYPDPLYSGTVYRPVLHDKGGSLLGENMPLSGGCDDGSDCSDYDSDSDYEGGYFSESSEGEYSSEDEIGGTVYSKYVKPAVKGLYNVGKHAVNDVIIPVGKEVGKEVLKKALMGALMGAGHSHVFGGRLSGTRDEFIHILKKIDPEFHASRKHSKNDLRNEVYKHLESTMSKKDLATLHYLDALAGYGSHHDEEGGINGNKSELQQILHKMYPELDLKKMSKEQIIKEIVGHVSKSKQSSDIEHHYKQVEKERLKEEKIKAYEEKQRLREAKHKKHKEEEVFEEPPPPYTEFEEPLPSFAPAPAPVKEVKKRGRPAKVKIEKEKKPRGRPAKVKIEKEKKPRGRPTKVKTTIKDPVKELDDIFKELENPKPEGGKIKKLIGTKKGNRARGAIVAEVMKKHGLNLPQASKYVSEHNLY